MNDVEFQIFWQKIKKPDWPEINNYADFCRLPHDIQQQANQRSPIRSMLDMIEDRETWSAYTVECFKYEDLVYVPIPKCASMYYRQVFADMGWQKTGLDQLDPTQYKFFGLIMHPLERWLKGLAQWLWVTYRLPGHWDELLENIERPAFRRLISTVLMGDEHTIPYSISLAGIKDVAHWIPMELFSDDGIKTQLMNFFARQGHTSIDLKFNDDRVNRSHPDKLKILEIVKDLYLENRIRQLRLYSIYADDLKFYHNIVDKFVSKTS